jgi:hypothetical protein
MKIKLFDKALDFALAYLALGMCLQMGYGELD